MPPSPATPTAHGRRRCQSAPVAVSGGGAGPLVTMTSSGRSLSVYWPGRLPNPQVSGDTALYRSVLPGVDLEITVSDGGGFRDVLIVRDKAAASNPVLRTLDLTAETTGGLQLTTSTDGALQAGTAGAAPAFTAPRPLMWDSATTAALPSRTSTAAAATAQRAAAATATAGTSTMWQPGQHAHAAWIGTSLTGPPRLRAGVSKQSLALVPDAGMLTSPATVYPVYVDPWLDSGGSRAGTPRPTTCTPPTTSTTTRPTRRATCSSAATASSARAPTCRCC